MYSHMQVFAGACMRFGMCAMHVCMGGLVRAMHLTQFMGCSAIVVRAYAWVVRLVYGWMHPWRVCIICACTHVVYVDVWVGVWPLGMCACLYACSACYCMVCVWLIIIVLGVQAYIYIYMHALMLPSAWAHVWLHVHI